MAGLFAYVAGSPAAYIGYYRVPAQAYGLLFALGVVGVMATNAINARLVKRLGGDRLLRVGAAGAALAALALVGNAVTGWGGLVGLAAALFVFVSMQGFVLANALAGAMQPFPDRAGTVAALVAASHAVAGIAGSMLLSLLADGTPRPLAWVIAISAAAMLASARASRGGEGGLSESTAIPLTTGFGAGGGAARSRPVLPKRRSSASP